MEGRALLDELVHFAQASDLDVRIAPFARPLGSAGGLCLLRGRRVVVLDGGASLVEQTSALAEALAEALGPDAPLTGASRTARHAIETAMARQRWRSGDVQPTPRTSPLERRVSVLRRPKPGLRSVRPKR